MGHRYLVGDAVEALASLPPASVDLCVTSPPFLGLRAYTDDPRELGTEGSPGEFLERLLRVTAAVGRVLKPEGSLCVELGDTFAGSGGAGGDYNEGGQREGQPKWRQNRDGPPERRKVGGERPGGHHLGGFGWPLGKSLCLIPSAYAIALAYGWNPLMPFEVIEPDIRFERWRIRNLICWARPNPTPGKGSDRFRVGTSYVVCATRATSRYFDHEAVGVPKAESPGNRYVRRVSETDALRRPDGTYAVSTDNRITQDHDPTERDWVTPLDWWDFAEQTWVIPNQAAPRSPIAASEHEHYAVMPEELARRLILAMCPPGGVVLDPFAGTGTTGAAAQGVGRGSVMIDLDPRNAELARERMGMFLEVRGADGQEIP